MGKTVEQIRRQHAIKWPDIWKQLGAGVVMTKKMRRRLALPRRLSMAAIQRLSRRTGLVSCWLSEITLCQATANVSNLQTDIEDFVPTTQPVRHPDTAEAA